MEPIVLDVGSGYTKAGYANPDSEPPLVSSYPLLEVS